MDKRQQLISDLKFTQKTLEDIKTHNETHRLFSTGLFYGLFFGLFSNFIIVLVFDLWIKNLSYGAKESILLISLLIIIAFLVIFLKEDKKFKKANKEIDDRRESVIVDIDRLEHDEGIVV